MADVLYVWFVLSLIDLIDEGFDLAIRVGQVGSDRLVARRLGAMQLVACAALAYLQRRGNPMVPQDLAAHNFLRTPMQLICAAGALRMVPGSCMTCA